MVANATGCSSIWGGSAPSTPYTKNKKGHGPAFGLTHYSKIMLNMDLGMFLGVKAQRETLAEKVKAADLSGDAKAVADEWLANMNEGEGTRDLADKFEAALEKRWISCC